MAGWTKSQLNEFAEQVSNECPLAEAARRAGRPASDGLKMMGAIKRKYGWQAR